MAKTRFYSNNEIFLQGMVQGVEFCNDSELATNSAQPNDDLVFKFVLTIEDNSNEVFADYETELYFIDGVFSHRETLDKQ